ncbi:uncharacterized protein LOC120677981 [Panicum virgatum]|uniref:uncharacterized protein LOC120677981 n=1 Tax=Panicum virgatum TaxID=38727 RepID=UPI0019D64BB6|nr:uncharacterized protein LOC120677981 [Panicum virgatum]
MAPKKTSKCKGVAASQPARKDGYQEDVEPFKSSPPLPDEEAAGEKSDGEHNPNPSTDTQAGHLMSTRSSVRKRSSSSQATSDSETLLEARGDTEDDSVPKSAVEKPPSTPDMNAHEAEEMANSMLLNSPLPYAERSDERLPEEDGRDKLPKAGGGEKLPEETPTDSQNLGNTVGKVDEVPQKAISVVQATTSQVSSGSAMRQEKLKLAFKLRCWNRGPTSPKDNSELNVLREQVKKLSSEKAALQEKIKKLSKAKKVEGSLDNYLKYQEKMEHLMYFGDLIMGRKPE